MAESSEARERRKAYMKAYYQAHRKERLADYQAHREQRRAEDHARRQANLEEHRRRDREWRRANRERLWAATQQWREENREEYLAQRKALYQKNKEQRRADGRFYAQANKEERRVYGRARIAALRDEVLNVYGRTCADCGTDQNLEIDHVDNDGTSHRAEVGTGAALYCWLRDNGYPSGFQILCGSCNTRKGKEHQRGGKPLKRPLSPEQMEKARVRTRAYGARLRAQALAAYGDRCAHCGTTEGLQIDHINEDGAAHRQEIGPGNVLYRWLEVNGYPEGFQTLCRSCNVQKSKDYRRALREQLA